MKETKEQHWRRIQTFIREAALVLDFLHWRVESELYGEQPTTPLFTTQAEIDGELTEDYVVSQLESIARQARMGFVEGKGFPVFLPLESYLNQLKSKEVQE